MLKTHDISSRRAFNLHRRQGEYPVRGDVIAVTWYRPHYRCDLDSFNLKVFKDLFFIVIVAEVLGHEGFKKNFLMFNETDGVDIVLSGGSGKVNHNSQTQNVVFGSSDLIKKPVVMHTGSYGMYIGHLICQFTSVLDIQLGSTVLLDRKFEESGFSFTKILFFNLYFLLRQGDQEKTQRLLQASDAILRRG